MFGPFHISDDNVLLDVLDITIATYFIRDRLIKLWAYNSMI